MNFLKKIYKHIQKIYYAFYYIYKFIKVRNKVIKIHREKDVLSRDGIEFIQNFWGTLTTALHIEDLLPEKTTMSNKGLEELSNGLIIRFLSMITKDLKKVGLTDLLILPESQRYDNTLIFIINLHPKFYKEAYNAIIFIIINILYSIIAYIAYTIILEPLIGEYIHNVAVTIKQFIIKTYF